MSSAVILKYDPTWKALEWAKEHCPSYISNTTVTKDNSIEYGTHYIKYYFSNEKDAMWFKLRWL